MSEDRRKAQRYLVKGRFVAVLSPNNILPYQVLDISRNGLAFSYHGQQIWEDELLQLELHDDENIYLDKIPIRIVSDCPLDESCKDLRRCGVQFGELTPTQKAQLEYFIQKHTIGLA
ncbi:MAG: PilZ domain-containing protein [Deltaproteobacteria bacterium]